MKAISTMIVALLWFIAAPAAAETLYRCVSSEGRTSYVNQPVDGMQCQVFSQYRPDYTHVPSPFSASPAVTPPPDSASNSNATISTDTPTETGTLTFVSVPTSVPPPPPSPPRQRVSGQVYSYMKDGVRHFSSTRPDNSASVGEMRTIHYELMDHCHACGSGNFGTARLNTEAYKEEITAASKRFGVEEAIIRAIIHAESAFKPNALSRAGAQGLMQLIPATARRFGVTDPWNPAQNIQGGVEYLAWLLRRFEGNLTLAAAGYNAGENAVDRHGGVPPYSETQFYVRHVAQLAERYRTELASIAAPVPTAVNNNETETPQ